jgi:hypothetical protein
MIAAPAQLATPAKVFMSWRTWQPICSAVVKYAGTTRAFWKEEVQAVLAAAMMSALKGPKQLALGPVMSGCTFPMNWLLPWAEDVGVNPSEMTPRKHVP